MILAAYFPRRARPKEHTEMTKKVIELLNAPDINHKLILASANAQVILEELSGTLATNVLNITHLIESQNLRIISPLDGPTWKSWVKSDCNSLIDYALATPSLVNSPNSICGGHELPIMQPPASTFDSRAQSESSRLQLASSSNRLDTKMGQPYQRNVNPERKYTVPGGNTESNSNC